MRRNNERKREDELTEAAAVKVADETKIADRKLFDDGAGEK